jgi:hypothetical protein
VGVSSGGSGVLEDLSGVPGVSFEMVRVGLEGLVQIVGAEVGAGCLVSNGSATLLRDGQRHNRASETRPQVPAECRCTESIPQRGGTLVEWAMPRGSWAQAGKDIKSFFKLYIRRLSATQNSQNEESRSGRFDVNILLTLGTRKVIASGGREMHIGMMHKYKHSTDSGTK